MDIRICGLLVVGFMDGERIQEVDLSEIHYFPIFCMRGLTSI